MAFGAKQIFPNDTRARVAIGIDLPFNGSAVFKSNYQTKDAIKNNLINYFLTKTLGMKDKIQVHLEAHKLEHVFQMM